MEKGILLVLSAPSGAGKTTLAHALLRKLPDAVFSVSCTTRRPRGHERDGVDYHFVSPQAFQEMIDTGALLEWAEVHGNRYGSPRRFVEASLREGSTVVFDVDVQGGDAIKKAYPEAVLVFILPPSLETLEKRLLGRSTDSPDQIARRLAAARAEMTAGVKSFDFVVINDQLQHALEEILCVVRGERLRRERFDPASFGL